MSTNFNWRLAVLALLAGSPAQAAGTPLAGRPIARLTTTLPHWAVARPGAASPATATASTPVPPAFQPSWLPVAAQPDSAQRQPAPQLVLLAGIVHRPDGQPCPGVCVFPTTNARQLAVTDAEGIFYLLVPAHTPLHIQADYFGVGSSQVAISGVAPQPVRIVLGQ